MYRCPYFALDVVPTEGLVVDDLEPVARGASVAYTGELVNQLDVAVRNASVTVFALNRAGRPLGVATDRSADELPPGGHFTFETTEVDVPAADYAAFPAGSYLH